MKPTGVIVRVDGQVYMGRFKSHSEATEYEQFVKTSKESGGIVGILDYDIERKTNQVLNLDSNGIDLIFTEELFS